MLSEDQADRYATFAHDGRSPTLSCEVAGWDDDEADELPEIFNVSCGQQIRLQTPRPR